MKEGATLECIIDYLNQLPEGKNSVQARTLLMKFVDIGRPDTIARWRKGTNKPLGLPLIKLRYFLEAQGYEVKELKALDKKIYNLGKLIAFNVVSFKEVSQRLGYAKDNGLSRVLHGKRNVLPEKIEKLDKILADLSDKLIKLPGIKKEQSSQDKALTATRPIDIQEPVVYDETLFQETKELLSTLDSTIALLEPRLKILLSDKTTAEQRQAFREIAGRHLVFDLSNRSHGLTELLMALCSEKAREHNNNKK